MNLGDGHIRHYASFLDACNAYAKLKYPYQQIIFDNGETVREMDERERNMLDHVSEMLGIESDEV